MKNYNTLESKKTELLNLSKTAGPIGLFAQEALRYISIAGTIYQSGIDLKNPKEIDGRYITHILSRSLIENYFKIIYIFDKETERTQRYNTFIDSFKMAYKKLLDESVIQATIGGEMVPADPSWTKHNLAKPLDLSSMLGQVQNQHNDKLEYLYAIYRVASFDTHGQNLKNITDNVFGGDIQFPILKLENGFEYIADEYITLLQNLKNNKEI